MGRFLSWTLVPALAVAAVVLGRFHEITGLGISNPAFAAQGDQTLRAAGYAFAVWGLLYLGMLAYAGLQAVPGRRDAAFTRRMRGPAALAFACVAAWVPAAALNTGWLTVGIIVTGALALIVPLSRSSRLIAATDGVERALAVWPLAALGGWLSIASAVNVNVVATMQGLVDAYPAVRSDLLWPYGAVAVVTIAALWVSARSATFAFAATVVWGLAAVFVAERADNPSLAAAAAGAAGLVFVLGLILSRRASGAARKA